MLEIKNCVKQEDEFGCQPACIATILNWTYHEAQRMFSKDFRKEGISGKQVSDFLSGFGFTSIWKALDYYIDYEKTCKEMLKPFADIHIASLQRFSDSPETGHAVIVTKSGLILDPINGEEFDNDILLVNSIFGYYYPPNWPFATSKGDVNNALVSSTNSSNFSSD